MSKILNGYENNDRNIFLSLNEDKRNRGHEVILTKKQCRLDMKIFSFLQRTVNEWNKLSAAYIGDSLKIKSTYTSEGQDTLKLDSR